MAASRSTDRRATDVLRRIGAEQRAMCLAARTSLADRARDRLAAVLEGPLDWDRLWQLAHLHEVGPLVGSNVTTVGGGVVPTAWRDRAIRQRHVTLRSNGILAAALGDVLDSFESESIAVMPVKGLVVAERLYGDIAARPCADLDVLVRPADLSRARDALRAIGFRQRAVPGFKALAHQFHDPAWARGDGADQVRLELHWALWADSDRRLGIDGLWERAERTTLLDRPVLTLSIEDTLLHLAIHRTRSALRLRWVVDVAELVRRHGATLDWAAFIERAGSARARTASWVVLMLARDLLDAPIPADVITQLRVGWPKRVLLERTCGTRALFRPAARGDVAQQPHLALRAFEEDGPVGIGRSLGGSATRPVREFLHSTGLRRVRPRTVAGVADDGR